MRKIGTDAYCLDVNGHCALLTSGKLILVDTATKEDGSLLIPEIEKCGYKASDVATIIITHTHPDHVGGLQKMKDLSNATLAAHELEVKFITKEEVYQGPPGPQSQRHVGTPIDDILVDGQTYEGLLVIHTPGHTPGHISLLDTESELLIAGDAIRNDAGKFNPMPDMYNFDPKQHRNSIKKLGNHTFTKAIVGHGDPVEMSADELMKALLNSTEIVNL
ncbi:MAG: MBL fold metallo-hydrolase [Candidatus Kariarchaeaceae archaeon]|jgi:glyoxylase-like metal-dependent hydrolase (beta-lactamase superfamily II)